MAALKAPNRLFQSNTIPQPTVIEQVPTEPVLYITDGLASDFLARHTQDKSLTLSDIVYQTGGASLFNDIPSGAPNENIVQNHSNIALLNVF